MVLLLIGAAEGGVKAGRRLVGLMRVPARFSPLLLARPLPKLCAGRVKRLKTGTDSAGAELKQRHMATFAPASAGASSFLQYASIFAYEFGQK